jgi:FixJ family two-component response regulator
MKNSETVVIAVIDDEGSVCKGIERLLRSAGLTAKTFVTGLDFLNFLKTNRPDCVVLDLNMMPMNGFEVLDQLALLQMKLPVIIITGDDSEKTRKRAINQDIVAYLLKPVDGELLLDAIASAVGNSGKNPRVGN